jgi:hypothetical protein
MIRVYDAAGNVIETHEHADELKMPGSKVIKHAQAHRHVTRSASVLHGWDDKRNPVPFSLNILSLREMRG